MIVAELKAIFSGDTSDYDRALAGVKAGNRAVASDVTRTWEKSGRDASAGFNRGFKLDDSRNQIDSLSGRLALLTQAAVALGPGILAGAVPAVAGLGGEASAAAIGAGAMALSFQGVGTALDAVNKQSIDPTAAHLKAMRQAMRQLTPEGRDMVRELRSWQAEGHQLTAIGQRRMFPGMIDGLDAAKGRLPQVRGLMRDLSTEIGDLSKQAGRSLAGPQFDSLFGTLKRDTPKLLDDTAHAAGNLVITAGNLWDALSPLSVDFSGGLRDATDDMAEWSRHVKGSAGMREFMDYARSDGKELVKTLGSIGHMLLSVGKAGAPLSGPLLHGLRDVADVVSKIAESDIGTPLIGGAIALGALNKASKGIGALRGLTGLLGGVAGLGKGGGVVGKVGKAAGVVPVFVTNPGFGGDKPHLPGGGPEKATTPLGATGRALALGAYSAPLGVAAVNHYQGGNPMRSQSSLSWAGAGNGGGHYSLPNSYLTNPLTREDHAKAILAAARAYRDYGAQVRGANTLLQQGTGLSKERIRELGEEATGSGHAAIAARLHALGMSYNTKAATRWVDTLRSLPPEVVTLISTKGVPQSKAGIDELKHRYGLTPKQVQTLVELRDQTPATFRKVLSNLHLLGGSKANPKANLIDRASRNIHKVFGDVGNLGRQIANPKANLNDRASGGINRVRSNLRSLDGDSATVTTFSRTVNTTVNRAIQDNVVRLPHLARGGVRVGDVRRYAAGGVDTPNGHQPVIARPGVTPRVWAEPETQGESYIPLAADSRRPRAVEIWRQTGRLLGQSFATGGLTTAQVAAARNAGATAANGTPVTKLDLLQAQAAITDAAKTLSNLSRVQALDVRQQKASIRDMVGQLNATEKTKNGRQQNTLRGNARADVQAQLAEARRELSQTQARNRSGIDQKIATEELTKAQQDYADLLKQSAGLERAKNLAEQMTGSTSIQGVSSAAQLSRQMARQQTLDQQWATTIAGLQKAGLSASIMDQFFNQGPSAQALRLGQSILGTQGAVGTLNRQQTNLNTQGDAYGAWAANGGTYQAPKLLTIENFNAGGMSPNEVAEQVWFLTTIRK